MKLILSPKKAYENEPLMSFDIQPYWWYRDTTENLLPDENSDEYVFHDRDFFAITIVIVRPRTWVT